MRILFWSAVLAKKASGVVAAAPSTVGQIAITNEAADMVMVVVVILPPLHTLIRQVNKQTHSRQSDRPRQTARKKEKGTQEQF